ncbi:MAG: hypothetical protein ACD_5C00165G0001, partial [uncultured bacterium]
MLLDNIKNKKAGFSLVEVLIFSLIVVIVVVTFYKTIASGAVVLRDAKARIAATQVANEVFETLRNVPYDDLIADADGPIFTSKEITSSGIKFTVKTDISYIDDVYDSTGEVGGTDLKPTDYRNIQVIISWKSSGTEKSIKMHTHIAPPGTEELYNGGILDIGVRRSDGVTPIDNARVQVFRAADNYLVHDYSTLSTGRAYFPGTDVGNYKVVVTKGGYDTVETMIPFNGGSQPYYPSYENPTVTLAGITHMNIYIDPLASLQLKTEDPIGNSIGNIDFSLEGGRVLGSYTENYYSFQKSNHNTDSSGEFTFSNQSSGIYYFDYLDTPNNDDYLFWKTHPLKDPTTTNNFFVNAGETTDVKAILIPKNLPSLFLRVVDEVEANPDPEVSTDPTPFSEAKVTVSNESLAYSKEQITDKFGRVYFGEDPLGSIQNAEYKVKIEGAAGYQDKEINIMVNNLTEQDIK